MLPSICRCCGCTIEARAGNNPNLCVSCEEALWREKPRETRGVPCPPGGQLVSPRQTPSELEQLLEVEGPTVIECFDAVEQAKEAILEAATQEPKPGSTPDVGVSRASTP